MDSGARPMIHNFGGQACGEVTERFQTEAAHAPSLSSGRSLRQALLVIGWGVAQVERRSRFSRHRIARWLSGQPDDESFVVWIGHLEALHRRLASPLSPYVRPDGNRPPLGPYEMAVARMTIGWSERQVAERSGEHRTSLRRLTHGRSHDWRLSRWLDLLADGHRTWPCPEPQCLGRPRS